MQISIQPPVSCHPFPTTLARRPNAALDRPTSENSTGETKLWWLRRRHGSRAACFATATPIANSIAELYVAQPYLQPAAIDAAGIGGFDAWAATFAATVAPTGSPTSHAR